MDTLAIEEKIKAALEKGTGGDARVKVLSSKLEFRVELGPRIPALGGFAGGETVGILRKGKLSPEMIAGIDPLGAERWVAILLPLGWFE
jgi:hypothetical protein